MDEGWERWGGSGPNPQQLLSTSSTPPAIENSDPPGLAPGRSVGYTALRGIPGARRSAHPQRSANPEPLKGRCGGNV